MSDKTTTIPTPIAGPKQFTPQTPTPNPQAPGSISTIVQYSIYNEKNEPVDLPVTYFNLFKAIYSTELMDVMATLGNPMYIAGGVAQYYIEQRGKTRNYTQGTALPFSATIRTDSLSCNWTKEIQYTYESLDLEQFGVKFTDSGILMSSAFISSINDRMVKAEMLLNQVKLFHGVANFAKDHVALTLIEPGVWKEQTPGKKDYVWVPDTSVDAYRGLWQQLTTFTENAKSSVSDEYVGLNFEDFRFISGPKLKVIINMLPMFYGDKSSTIATDLNITSIAGIPVKFLPFLGKTKFNVGDIDVNEEFDLTPVHGILMHKEGWGYPINYGETIVGRIPNTGNLVFTRKWRINENGGKAIRPTLIYGIVVKRPEPPTDAVSVDGVRVI